MTGNYWRTNQFEFGRYELVQSEELPQNATALISFVNDEDRAMGLFQLETSELGSIKEVHLIILNRNLDDYENPDLDNLIAKAKKNIDYKMELHIHYLNFYTDKFATNVVQLFQSHGLLDTPVIIDFTSCPQSVIIPFSEALIGHSNKTVTIAYIVPEKYDYDLIKEIEDQEVNGEIVTYGHIEKSNSVLGIIAGFEDLKTRRIVDHVKPSFGYIFNNIFTQKAEEVKTARETMDLHSDIISLEQFKQINLPRYDANRILNILQLVYSPYDDNNLILAVFGSKIQKLFALLFVESHPNLAIIDIIPNNLSFRKISSGIKSRLFYSIRRK